MAVSTGIACTAVSGRTSPMAQGGDSYVLLTVHSCAMYAALAGPVPKPLSMLTRVPAIRIIRRRLPQQSRRGVTTVNLDGKLRRVSASLALIGPRLAQRRPASSASPPLRSFSIFVFSTSCFVSFASFHPLDLCPLSGHVVDDSTSNERGFFFVVYPALHQCSVVALCPLSAMMVILSALQPSGISFSVNWLRSGIMLDALTRVLSVSAAFVRIACFSYLFTVPYCSMSCRSFDQKQAHVSLSKTLRKNGENVSDLGRRGGHRVRHCVCGWRRD